jgi:hypothetical protein
MTLAEVGDVLGVSKQRVHQVLFPAGEHTAATAATAAVTPEKRRQEERRSLWPWKGVSLDAGNLMRVRRSLRFTSLP